MFVEIGKQLECDGYCWVQVCVRNICCQVDSYCYFQILDDVDFLLFKSSFGNFKCSDIIYIEKN